MTKELPSNRGPQSCHIEVATAAEKPQRAADGTTAESEGDASFACVSQYFNYGILFIYLFVETVF